MNILSSNYLSRKPIDNAMKDFGNRFSPEQRVLDIGCGEKPYRGFFSCEYIGLDTEASVKPDIVANAWSIPLPDASFDGIILNQSLEHIAQTQKAIKEIWRLLKPNGIVIVTVPHAMRNHSSPLPASSSPIRNFDVKDHPTWRMDYYRFTKFGLLYVFQNFRTISINETSGYVGTILQLINYFFASLGLSWLFFPIYAINNLMGIIMDSAVSALARIPVPTLKKFYDYTYSSLTINYICIFEKPAAKEVLTPQRNNAITSNYEDTNYTK